MIDLRPRLKEPAICELISLSIGSPTSGRIEQICQRYQHELHWQILGYERNGIVVGCIGIEVPVHKHGFIRCISVLPSARGQGIARNMIQHLTAGTDITQLFAETDGDAVGFIENVAFK